MRIVDAQIHLWGSGLPSNMAHRQVTSFTTEEALGLVGRLGHPSFALGTLAVHAAVGPPAAHRRSPPLTGDQPLVFDT
jgi:hypothetical protein